MVGRLALGLRHLLILTSLHLTTILEADPSHFLRILVADAIRGLLYNGAEPVVFGKSAAARKMIKMLPRSKNGGSKWMSDLVDYLRQIDLAKASTVEYITCFV